MVVYLRIIDSTGFYPDEKEEEMEKLRNSIKTVLGNYFSDLKEGIENSFQRFSNCVEKNRNVDQGIFSREVIEGLRKKLKVFNVLMKKEIFK